jgi:hypothetical protein
MPRFLKDYWACWFLSFQSDQITKSANSLPRVDFNTRQSVCHVIDKRHWTKTVLFSLLSLNDIWLVLHLARLFPSVFSRNLLFPILRDWMFCGHQPSILFSQNILAPVTNQSAVLFSRNKSVPAFSHNPAGQVRLGSMPFYIWIEKMPVCCNGFSLPKSSFTGSQSLTLYIRRSSKTPHITKIPESHEKCIFL